MEDRYYCDMLDEELLVHSNEVLREVLKIVLEILSFFKVK